jgi:uncharacterized protein
VTDLPGRLESLVRSTPWLLEALRAARDVDPPDWLVGCGLDDLFGLVCRRNPRRVTEDHYRRRVLDKRVAERWPRVGIVL